MGTQLTTLPPPTPCSLQQPDKMGRVRTKTVKKSAKVLIERYYPRLTLDFETNKRICDEIAVISSKRLRNKIAGYTTHLMKRIQRGPVRGISFKLQEEDRERTTGCGCRHQGPAEEHGLRLDRRQCCTGQPAATAGAWRSQSFRCRPINLDVR